MERNDLLNLLYVERQRLSEQNNQIGWSIWILIGGIITLSWMLLEHYETVIQLNGFEFCWSQVITLLGDFSTIAFALLLIKNYYSDRETDYRSDRFSKSKLPVFIILDMTIATLLYIYYKVFSNDMIDIIITFTLMCYVGVKYAELYQIIKCKQQMPLLLKQVVYISASVMILVGGTYKINMHYEYYIVNTKYALLSCGIIIVSYILSWNILNPIKKSILSIDKLINNMIVNESINTELVYNEFITIKIGHKYSQLFESRLEKITKLLNKQDVYITLLKKNIDDLELLQETNIKKLNRSMNLFNDFQTESKVSSKLAKKLLSKMKRDLKHIVLNQENKLEIEKIFTTMTSNFNLLENNDKAISELLGRFKEIIEKQQEKYSNCSHYCRFANNRFLCYSHRLLHYLKKQSNVNNCGNK